MTKHEGRSFDDARAEIAGRNVTADTVDGAAERFEVYRLCECTACVGTGQAPILKGPQARSRCKECRGEGRTRDLVGTCSTPEALGVLLVTLGREGEWEGCPIGILDTLGETGQKWIVRPWLPSPRNTSDAGRVLANSKKEKTT